MKETKQTYIEKIDAMEKHLGEGYEGLILTVKEKTNSEYFGDKSKYGTRNGLELTVKVNGETPEEFTQWMGIPDKMRGLQQSNLYAFKQKYGNYPIKGQKIDVCIDENGFFKVVL